MHGMNTASAKLLLRVGLAGSCNFGRMVQQSPPYTLVPSANHQWSF